MVVQVLAVLRVVVERQALAVSQATALQDIQASLVTQASAVILDTLVNLVILASQDSAVGPESPVILA